MRRFSAIAVVLVFLTGVGAALAQTDEKTVTVEVSVAFDGTRADGHKRAKTEAMRMAVEEAAPMDLFSKTETRDFVLVMDRVMTRAGGFVTDFEVLEEGPLRRGEYFMKARVTVSQKAFATAWGEAQLMLEQVGRPRVMTLIGESIDGVGAIGWAVAGKIENRLLELGFTLVDKGQVEAIKEADLQEAALEQDVAKLVAIGRQTGAEIVLTGRAEAMFGGTQKTYGVMLHMFDANVDLRAIRTSTGQIISSESSHAARTSQTKQGARDALVFSADKLASQLIMSMFRKWVDDAQTGVEVRLVATVADFELLMDFEDVLEEMEGVSEVNERSYRGGIAEIDVKYLSPGGNPARALARQFRRVEDLQCKVTGVQQNRIDVTVTGEDEDEDEDDEW